MVSAPAASHHATHILTGVFGLLLVFDKEEADEDHDGNQQGFEELCDHGRHCEAQCYDREATWAAAGVQIAQSLYSRSGSRSVGIVRATVAWQSVSVA